MFRTTLAAILSMALSLSMIAVPAAADQRSYAHNHDNQNRNVAIGAISGTPRFYRKAATERSALIAAQFQAMARAACRMRSPGLLSCHRNASVRFAPTGVRATCTLRDA